jgi:hypothetical protein
LEGEIQFVLGMHGLTPIDTPCLALQNGSNMFREAINPGAPKSYQC